MAVWPTPTTIRPTCPSSATDAQDTTTDRHAGSQTALCGSTAPDGMTILTAGGSTTKTSQALPTGDTMPSSEPATKKTADGAHCHPKNGNTCSAGARDTPRNTDWQQSRESKDSYCSPTYGLSPRDANGQHRPCTTPTIPTTTINGSRWRAPEPSSCLPQERESSRSAT